jgi:hypothetical protein
MPLYLRCGNCANQRFLHTDSSSVSSGAPREVEPSVMRPSPLTRVLWLLQDIWELSPLARLHRPLHGLRDPRAAKAVGGLVVASLVVAGFIAARTVARAPNSASPPAATQVITVQRRVLQRVGDRLRTRRDPQTVYAHGRTVYAHGRTVTQPPGLRTVNAVRVVTTPAGNGNGETRTVSTPVTDTVTRTSTRLVTVTRPVTVAATTTVVLIRTVSVPVTITVTVP